MLARLLLVAFSLAIITGCGAGGLKTNPVTGKVMLDGVPIEGATVTFSPVEGGTGSPAAGRTDANGVYKVSDLAASGNGGGAVAGDYKIGVLWYKATGPDLSQSTGSSEMKEDKKARVQPSGPDALLPTYYANPETSLLKFTVVPGSNEYNIELDSKFNGKPK